MYATCFISKVNGDLFLVLVLEYLLADQEIGKLIAV